MALLRNDNCGLKVCIVTARRIVGDESRQVGYSKQLSTGDQRANELIDDGSHANDCGLVQHKHLLRTRPNPLAKTNISLTHKHSGLTVTGQHSLGE
jgi:hypothetical protein